MAEETKKTDNFDEVNLSKTQLSMYKGFSEDLYGNNWFVLTTNEGGASTSICGVLDSVPELSFSTKLSDGPQKTLTDVAQKFLTERDTPIAAVGAAVGANFNVQLAGDFTKKIATGMSFQERGFDLSFDVWKRPEEIFDRSCLPSSMKDVISYLTKYATVKTEADLSALSSTVVNQALAGIGSLIPIAKDVIFSGAESLYGKDWKSGSADFSQVTSGGFFEAAEKFIDVVATEADQTFVRGWSDKQRITIGRDKFNESLHRLDVLRAGVLDSYVIVGIESWDYKIDQSSLGECMKVNLKCKLDQRMTRDRLRLYSDTGRF